MIIAVASCWKYRDAWKPFFLLLNKFWPDRPYQVWLLTDNYIIGEPEDQEWIKENVPVFIHPSTSWCAIVHAFCQQHPDEPILLLQEDFFLTESVREDLIIEAEKVHEAYGAGCTRLYPCPGPKGEIFVGGRFSVRHFSVVLPGEPYRISCQAAIWKPSYLSTLCSRYTHANDFELRGSRYSSELHEPVFSFRREVKPWPLEYICTGIVRGVWQKGALELFKRHGIEVDLSLRPVEQ